MKPSYNYQEDKTTNLKFENFFIELGSKLGQSLRSGEINVLEVYRLNISYH